MRMSRWIDRILLLVIVLAVAAAIPAAAQAQEGDHNHDPFADPTVAPMIMPTVTDFAPEAGDTAVQPDKGDVGVTSYFEFSDTQKAGLLTPFYRLSRSLALKARVPLIFNKTVTFGTNEGKASGLGDVTFEAEYSKVRSAGAVFSFTGSVKLPTGDEEKVDNFIAVPLGTGTLDYFAKAQYAKSQPDFGWVASVIFRKNSGYEFDPWGTSVALTTTTSGNQVIGSVFARKRVNAKWWLHLGASADKIADGAGKTVYTDGTPTFEYDMTSGGTVIDLYPGMSYALGKLNPYLGARVPVSTSWNNEFASTDRDMAFIFQFTYRPDRMAGQ